MTAREPMCDWPRLVVHVDPSCRFGEPFVRGPSCEAVAELVWVGEDLGSICADYGLTRSEALLSCWYVATHGTKAWRRRWKDWLEASAVLIAKQQYDDVEDPPDRSET